MSGANNSPRILEVKVTEDQMNVIKQEVISDLETNFTRDKLMEHIRGDTWLSAIELLREFGIYQRYEGLKERTIESLNRHEKMIVACYWLMYESFDR